MPFSYLSVLLVILLISYVCVHFCFLNKSIKYNTIQYNTIQYNTIQYNECKSAYSVPLAYLFLVMSVWYLQKREICVMWGSEGSIFLKSRTE